MSGLPADTAPLEPMEALLVEVTYDHVTGARFRHGTGLKRRPPDKAPRHTPATSCSSKRGRWR